MSNEVLNGNFAKPMLVAGFPGTGKSSYCYRDADYMPQGFATDSDSSKFDKANFPQNYIEHIKEKISELSLSKIVQICPNGHHFVILFKIFKRNINAGFFFLTI